MQPHSAGPIWKALSPRGNMEIRGSALRELLRACRHRTDTIAVWGIRRTACKKRSWSLWGRRSVPGTVSCRTVGEGDCNPTVVATSKTEATLQCELKVTRFGVRGATALLQQKRQNLLSLHECCNCNHVPAALPHVLNDVVPGCTRTALQPELKTAEFASISLRNHLHCQVSNSCEGGHFKPATACSEASL